MRRVISWFCQECELPVPCILTVFYNYGPTGQNVPTGCPFVNKSNIEANWGTSHEEDSWDVQDK